MINAGIYDKDIAIIERTQSVKNGDIVVAMDEENQVTIKRYYKEKDYIFDGNKAVNNGEVYLQMAYNAYYTNIEIALMDAYFDGASVYPDAFKDIDLATKCDEITTMMNGKALYNDIKAMDSSFGGFQKIENFKEFLSK